jgi:tetratricopeptide (TPR) repeat protein
MSNVHEKDGAGGGINEFIQKNRKPIFVSFSVLFLLFVGFIVAFSLLGALRKKAISEVEGLNARYEALRFTIAEESSAADVEALLGDLEAVAKKTSGYAGGRAWAIIAGIHGDKKEWAEAEAAWTSAAKAAAKTYLASAAWFNAGAAAEEQGRVDEAVGCYTQSLANTEAFPAAPRAQFAIGRLKEAQGDHAAAIAAYREVISKWSYDTVWNNLAQSRIIALEARQ